MSKNYEEILPEGYNEIFHIDAKDKKTGLILTLFSLILTLIPLAILLPIYFCTKKFEFEFSYRTSLYLLGLAVAMILYMVLHELVHGIAYKALTKQKLTFGISWSCAYCGVPNIYVYRKASMIALIAPFAVFSLLFGGLVNWFYFLDGTLFLLMSLLFSIHVGGCIGDLYMFTLFLFKYKDKTLLMKDTGPEQFLYQKIEN
ncbi:MAG: DUF3267 domain-containing protein [Anaeroplasmataceae bacterium]|nr:DUF3267 domain-containing protein [Anaeroplasmataceae bacterium]